MKPIYKIVAALVVLVGTFTITWFVYFPHSPWGKQEANLKLAHVHEPIVVEKLRHTEGAEQVNVGVYTGLGGALGIGGKVKDSETAERVVADVMATMPPVPVDFNISISDTDMLQRVVQPNASVNGSQPIRSETNRTSPAAGSRR
jgi:hypothetical protein